MPASVIRIDHNNGSTERIHTGYFGGQIAQQVERTSKTCDHVPENTIPDSNDEEKGECDAAHEEVICISLNGDESIDLADKLEESTEDFIQTKSKDHTATSDPVQCVSTASKVNQEQEGNLAPEEHQSRQVQAAAKSTNHPLDQSGITVDYQFQTRLGVAVKEVLGDKEDVRKLDKKHHYLKHLKSNQSTGIRKLQSYFA